MPRKKTNKNIEADVLVDSRRRCCICFGLNRDLEVKKGQIAHLDKDSSNNAYDNLVFLCIEHHEQYDLKTSQSKNFTITEAKRYREELKENFLTAKKPLQKSKDKKNLTSEEYKKEEIRKVLIEILTEDGTISQYSYVAHKIGLPARTVENFLNELAQENRLRIDRPRGSTKKTFSLIDSDENLIIDAFIRNLNTKIIQDDRFLRKKQYEIDAIIKTKINTFIIEVQKSQYLTPLRIRGIVKRIDESRKEFRIEDSAKSILLIGITDKTKKLDESIENIEEKGVIIKYVEIKKNFSNSSGKRYAFKQA